MSNELAVLGADTANQQAGGPSIFDATAMFTGSAVLSGLSSIYNTFVDYGNKLGGDFEALDTGRMLENYDRDWYSFYKEHQQAIDVTGFVAGSFIPGTLAIKGLKVAQAGMGAGAIGRAVSGTLNFANAKRDAAVAAGLDEIAREGGSAYAYINANKLSAIGWGFAEQALQAGAFETATALTMKQSPVLADRGNSEILSDIGFGMLTGGVFGGAIDGILTNKVFKDAVSQIALKRRPYDNTSAFEGLGLGIGDEAYGYVDSLLALPADVLANDTAVSFTSALNKKTINLNIEDQLKRTLSKTEKQSYVNVQESLKKLGTVAVPEAGQQLSDAILGLVRTGVANGTPKEEIRQKVGNILLGLKKFRTLTDDSIESFARDDLFYINHEVDLKTLGSQLHPALVGTKVVDAAGKPLKVYHGTTADFTNYKSQGDGIFFTDSAPMASRYASGEGGNVRPVFLSMKNPAPFEAQKAAGFSRSKLAAQGYDGYIEQMEGRKIYVAFNDDQAVNALATGDGTVAAGSVSDLMNAAFSRKPFEKNATAKPYQIIGDTKDAKVTTVAHTFQEGFDAGNDLVIIGGKLRINPKSEIFAQIKDPNLVPSRYFNTRTLGVSDEVVPTWADMLPPGVKPSASVMENGVSNGKKFINLADEISPSDAYMATARHAWASTLPNKHFAGATVDVADISRMERLAQLPRNTLESLGTKVRDADGGISNASDVDLTRLLSESKLTKMQEMLDAGTTDMREIGYVLNAPDSWMERAIANGFQRTAEDTLIEGASNELSSYLARENFLATWASPRSLVGLGAVDAETLAATEAAATTKGGKYLDSFVTGQLGFMQRVQLSEDLRKRATAAVFGGEDAGRFLDVTAKDAMKMANELGVGAGLLAFSNANYGDILKLWAQHTGMLTHQLIKKVADANLEKLTPYIAKLQDNRRAGAELGVILSMLRASPSKFVLAFDNTAGGIEKLVVREATIVDRATGMRVINNDKLDAFMRENATTGRLGTQRQAAFTIEHLEVLDFLKTWRDSNGERINKRAVLMNSRGATLGWDPSVIYAPPIDTQKYSHFAFVKVKEGHIAGGSDVGMITARTPEELSKLSQEVDSNLYDVFFKRDTEQFFKIKNEYDAQLALNEPRVDSNLRKSGKLADFFYEVRSENVLEDFIRYSQDADAALVRHGVETRYAQLVTELHALGKQYTEVATSQMAGLAKQYDRSVINPFGDYVRTALDISKRSSFPLVHQLNEFVDSVGTRAYQILVSSMDSAKKGLVPWQEAERQAMRYGIGGVYNAENVETAFNVANRPMDRNLIREGVSKVNMFLATAGLRLDMANSIVNIISMPIMLGTELASLKSLAKNDPAAIGALSELFTTTSGTGVQVPSYTKLIGTAIKNVIGDGGKDLVESYRKSGDVKGVMAQFHEMLGDIAINPLNPPKAWSDKVNSWVEKGSKWTGNNFAEDFTRALSANVMDQMTAPLITRGLLTSQEAAAYRSVFVNRVNGNYIASQRPILFQGTVGAAISLFQTYVFNVMQQMTRHIENRDLRALLTMTGLQGATYGLNGLPFFEAVNTHLIGNASINDGHRDVYSYATQVAGKEAGNWLLYGTASAFPLLGGSVPALYTRGDINPRHVSILPISPLDVPAVSVASRIVQNIWDVGDKIVQGADLRAALLEGLEHNGVSRPLAGFAQFTAGYTTTSKGSLVSSSNDFNAVVDATRMIGAKPMDESVALNTMYRLNAYRAADLARLSQLGEVVKTKLRKNQSPTPEEMQQFMKQYASAGGNLQNYSQALQRWSRDANMSVVNQMKQFHQSQYAQRLTEIMGGTTLDDFRNAQSPPEQTATP